MSATRRHRPFAFRASDSNDGRRQWQRQKRSGHFLTKLFGCFLSSLGTPAVLHDHETSAQSREALTSPERPSSPGSSCNLAPCSDEDREEAEQGKELCELELSLRLVPPSAPPLQSDPRETIQQFTVRPSHEDPERNPPPPIANLHTLSLEGNQIGDSGAMDVARSIRHDADRQQSLRRLRIGRNHIGDRGAGDIVDALISTRNTVLKELDLSENRIGNAGAAALGRLLSEAEEPFQTTSRLRVLKLAENAIGPAGAEAIAKRLQRNYRLRHLDLSHNPQIGDEGATALAACLTEAQRHMVRLQILDLSKCQIGPVGRSEMAKALRHREMRPEIDMTSAETSLEDFLVIDVRRAGSQQTRAPHSLCLQFSKVRFLDSAEIEIGNLWKSRSATLEVIKMEYFPERMAVPRILETRALLRPNCPLRTLRLGGANFMRNREAAALAKVLRECRSSLRILDLSHCDIWNDGLSKIVPAVWPEDKEAALRELYLCYNRIDSEGAHSLATALGGQGENLGLEKLDLYGNRLNESGAVHIGNALHQNSSLQVLNLGYNLIGDEGVAAIASGLEHNTSLRELYLRPIPGMSERGRRTLYNVALTCPNRAYIDAILPEG